MSGINSWLVTLLVRGIGPVRLFVGSNKAFTPRSLFRNTLTGCESNRVVNEQRLLTRVREFERVTPGVRAQPPWLLSDPESNRFGTKSRAARSKSSQTPENGARNAKSREHSLSAFCVNWLTAPGTIPFDDRRSKRVNSRGRSKIETCFSVATFLDREGNAVSPRGDQR